MKTMAPNSSTTTVGTEEEESTECQKDSPEIDDGKLEIVWRNVIKQAVLHLGGFYGAYLGFTKVSRAGWIFFFIYGYCSALGITAGAHRLWSHKSYKAKLPLRIMLMIFNCIACQNNLYEWCRDHRVHHKFSETNADPHNVKRGFFFAHMGWLMCKKHPQVIVKGGRVDCSDLLKDPVVAFQRKYYVRLAIMFNLVVSVVIPMLFCGETFRNSFYFCTLTRYLLSLHFTWFVNSLAHLYGNRPFDENISPRENYFVSWAAAGEGFHNYHHTFPWDYSTSELGWTLNFTTMFLDIMAFFGQVYDRKTVPRDMLRKRMLRSGDGTRRP